MSFKTLNKFNFTDAVKVAFTSVQSNIFKENVCSYNFKKITFYRTGVGGVGLVFFNLFLPLWKKLEPETVLQN